jgi:hypothetical protein
MQKESVISPSIKRLYGNIDKKLWITGKFDPVAVTHSKTEGGRWKVTLEIN